MTLTVSDVEEYLADVYSAVQSGRYQLSTRQKNQDMFIDYVFTEEDARQVLLSLTAYDFSNAVGNVHTQYPDEVLYIFGKDIMLLPRYGEKEEKVPLYIKINKLANQYVIIISLHKQEYPLHYPFR